MENLNDKVVRMLRLIGEAEKAMEGINDYGEASGLCDEHDQIHNHAFAQISMLCARFSQCVTRAQRHKKAQSSANIRHEPRPNE